MLLTRSCDTSEEAWLGNPLQSGRLLLGSVCWNHADSSLCLLSLQCLHSTPAAERGSVHSAATCPDWLQRISLCYTVVEIGNSPAVTTSKAVLAFLLAVTGTVADFVTVDTLDTNDFTFHLLLRAGLRDVTKLCSEC